MYRLMRWVAVVFVLLIAWALLGSELRLLLLVLAVTGGYLAVTSGLRLLRQRQQPTLAAVPAELRPGEPFVVSYGPPAMAAEGLRGIRLRLICRELRKRKVKGRTVTDKHDWVVEEADGEMRGEHRFTVPPDAMHSFGSRNHEIAWLVEARGRGRQAANVPTAVMPLTVLPDRYVP
jgi:hypothetical protein